MHQQIGEVLDGTAQPVELQDDKGIAALQRFKCAVKAGAAGFAPGDAVIPEYLIALRRLQRIKLHPQLLILRGNPRVAYLAARDFEAWEKVCRHDATSTKSILFADAPQALVLVTLIGGVPPFCRCRAVILVLVFPPLQ
jgi:hypothetical protein